LFSKYKIKILTFILDKEFFMETKKGEELEKGYSKPLFI
jgi:hypothetical protein